MSTVPAVEIDSNDVTDEMQDRSLSIKRQSVDLTLIDPAVMPALGDTLTVDTPAWSGTVVHLESVGYEGDVPFVKVRATNSDALPDNGAGAFNLSDAGTPQGNPAAYRDLVVVRTKDDAVEEVRLKCVIFKEGLEAGDEVDITSAVHGFSAETFTVLEVTTEYDQPDAARYTLDLGLGEYTDASTGAADGGPLYFPTLGGEINRRVRKIITNEYGGGTGMTYAVALESNTFSSSAGNHDAVWDEVYLANDPWTTLSGVIPTEMGLTLENGDVEVTAAADATYVFWVAVTQDAGAGNIRLNHPMFHGNPLYIIPSAHNAPGLTSVFHWEFTVSMLAGEYVSLTYDNDLAAQCIQYIAMIVTRLGTYSP